MGLHGPAAATRGDPAKAQKIVNDVCGACHSPNGAGIPVQFPRLAGQHARYVKTQLRNFRSGDRANDGVKMMQVIARKMIDREMRAVAEFIFGLR